MGHPTSKSAKITHPTGGSRGKCWNIVHQNTTKKYHATDFYCIATLLLHAHCRVSLPLRIHGHTECIESTFQRQNVRTERKMSQKDVFQVKIIEKYNAAFKNPTKHGANCGTFTSKNTTRNRKFHENPTPRWDFLKSVSKALIILDQFRVFSAWFD